MTPFLSSSADTASRLVTSRHSASVRRLRDLQLREGRDRSGLYLIDGIRHVAQAMEHGLPIETLIVAPKVLTSVFGQRLVRQAQRQGAPLLSLSPEVYHSLSQAEEPQGLAAVLRQRWERLENIRPSNGLCWIAVEALQSPGNLGTILRTSDAVGGAGLILIGETTDPYDPATVRASMGALFTQRFVRTTPQHFAEWKKRRQFTLVGTSPSAREDYHEIAYPKPTMLLMGCEKRGLSPEIQKICDRMVTIPMVGRSDSLNVAVATSVLLYELFNQRRSGKPTENASDRPVAPPGPKASGQRRQKGKTAPESE